MVFLSCAEAQSHPKHREEPAQGYPSRSESESVSTACLEAQREAAISGERCMSIGPALFIYYGRTAGRQAHRGGLRSAWHSKKTQGLKPPYFRNFMSGLKP